MILYLPTFYLFIYFLSFIHFFILMLQNYENKGKEMINIEPYRFRIQIVNITQFTHASLYSYDLLYKARIKSYSSEKEI